MVYNKGNVRQKRLSDSLIGLKIKTSTNEWGKFHSSSQSSIKTFQKNYFSGSAMKSTSLSAAAIKLLSKQGNKIFKTYKCQRSNFNECQAISGSELLGRCEGIKLFSFRWSCFPEICLQLANSIQFVNTIEYYWCHLHTYTWTKYWRTIRTMDGRIGF